MANYIDSDIRRSIDDAVEEFFEPPIALQQLVFKQTKTFETTKIDLDLRKGVERTVGYVRRIEQGNYVEKTGFETREIEPPYLKPKKILRPEDFRKRIPGEILYAQGKERSGAVQKLVAHELMDLDNIIVRNHAVAQAELLVTGKVTARDDEGVAIKEIDFQRDDSLTRTTSNLWSDQTNGDPLGDFETDRQTIADLSDQTADFVILGSELVPLFLKHPNVRQSLSKDWAARGELTRKMRKLGLVWLGEIDELDIYTLKRSYLALGAGGSLTRTPYIPAKKYVIGSSEAEAGMYYGAIEHVSNPRTVPRWFDTYNQDDPSGEVIQLHSAGMPVTRHVNAYATTTAKG